MKNILIIIFFIAIFITPFENVNAAENEKTPIRFIYINGSNNNTEKDKLTFINGINHLHTYMKKNFENDSFISKHMLNDGEQNILNKPKIFFWGYDSISSLNNIKDNLITLDMISPKIAQSVRKMIAGVMHDAIWVQKEHNMQVVINNLHKDVMYSHERGEKVVLFGHSAGSFITYRYLFHKLPAISNAKMADYAEKNMNLSDKEFYGKYKFSHTCIDAIIASGLGIYSATGEFIVNKNQELLKQGYLKLNDYTKCQCIPDGQVLGVVNFGSPVALFYSDNGVSSQEINKYNIDLYRYLKDNNMFFLTVNFIDDPIGFPLSKNLSSEEIENVYHIGFNTTGKGFFYSKSDVKSPATFIGAHNSYWKCPEKFSKAVVRAFTEGYKNFYSEL